MTTSHRCQLSVGVHTITLSVAPGGENSPGSPVPWLVGLSGEPGTPVIADTSKSTRYRSPLPQLTSFAEAGRTMLYAPPEVRYHAGAAGYRRAVDQFPSWFTYTTNDVLFAQIVAVSGVPSER